MITTGQIYLAYRKLKGELYYDNNALLPKVTLAKWEQELTHNHVSCDKEEFENLFSDRVSLLLAFLNDNEWKSNNYLNQLLGSIDYQTIVKSISSDETDSGIGTYITNYKYKNKIRVEKCNYMIVCSVEVQLIATLWLLYLNQYIDRKKLYKYNYANKLRTDSKVGNLWERDEEAGYQLSITNAYQFGYRKWRDTAIMTANKLLDKKNNAAILNLDIQRYYYSVSVELQSLLRSCFERGYIQRNYAEDETLLRLTSMLQVINKSYTEKVKPCLTKENIRVADNQNTLLPVGLMSSGMIGNLILTDFDEQVETLGCEYYGRYVDDMLFVFKGKVDDKQQDVIKGFLQEKFVDNDILDCVEVEDRTEYHICSHPELVIQGSKVVMEAFKESGPRAALKIFEKKLREQSSEFRFLSDDGAIDQDFENEAYELQYTDSPNKIRNINAFKANSYGISKYLAKKINLAAFISESKEEKDKDRQTANQIVALVKGSVAIDMHYLWEKVITYFVIKEDASHLNKLLKQLKTAIAWLRIPDDKDREERLKNDMKKMLDAAIIYAFAPFPTFLDKLEERIVDVDPSVVSQFRMANMTRHSRFGTSALNYTNLITNVNRNFYKKDKIQLGANDVKVNIFYWLSPRFVYYYELYMPVLLCSLNPDDGVLKLNEVNKKTHSLYSRLNFVWMKMFDLSAGVTPKLFETAKRSSGKVLEIGAYEFIKNGLLKKNVYKDCDKTIGIVNMKVESTNYVSSLKSKPVLSKTRSVALNRILDESDRQKCEVLVLPELSVPFQWIELLATQSQRKKMAIVSGLEYVINRSNEALNIVATFLPIQWAKYKTDCIPVLRLKNHYAPSEKQMIVDNGLECPKSLSHTDSCYDLFHWRNSYFSVYNCFELASIEDRALMKGKVDFLIATEFNRDVLYYSDIVGSLVRDLHCFVIQCNTSQFGDSRIMQPTESILKNMVRVKGGKSEAVLTEIIEISSLRKQQRESVKKYANPKPQKKAKEVEKTIKFKDTPPGFNEYDIMTRENGYDLIDPAD